VSTPIVAAFELSHTPVRPLTSQEIDARFNSGDWRQPVWFTQTKWKADAELRGFSTTDLHSAAHALADAYPSEVCRELLQKAPRFSRLVYGLFHHTPQWGQLVGLGLDLAACAGRLRPDTFLRLRDPEAFKGVDLEIQIQANGIRSGLTVDRPPGEGTAPRADYILSGLPVAIQVEVKSRGTFTGEDVAADVADRLGRFGSLHGYSPPQDRQWHIEGIGRLRVLPMTAAGRRELDDLERSLFEGVGEALERARSNGWAADTFEIAGLARLYVSIALGDGGRSWSIDLFDGIDPAYEADRAAEVVRRYQTQIDGLGRSLPGIFFLDLPWETPLAPIREAIEKDIASSPASYRFLDGVILRTRGRRRQNDPLWEWHEWFTTAWATPRARLGDAFVQDVAARIADSPHRLFAGWLRNRRPDPPADPARG